MSLKVLSRPIQNASTQTYDLQLALGCLRDITVDTPPRHTVQLDTERLSGLFRILELHAERIVADLDALLGDPLLH